MENNEILKTLPGEEEATALPEPMAEDIREEDMDDTQEFDLEAIMKEFGGESLPEEPEEAAEETPAQETEAPEASEAPEAQTEEAPEEALRQAMEQGDTIRLDTIDVPDKPTVVSGAMPISEEEDRKEAFSEQWEPEYEQPMGEYVPPQPIQFRPRSKIRELKRKLVAGPEKLYYSLSEKGLGKLQAAMFLSLLTALICAVTTAMYAYGFVPEERLKLLVFGQFFAMLVSALLGSFQLIEGVSDVFKGRFTLNTMLVLTFLVCCVDGILGLQQLRLPCCAAFSLEVTMSLWSAYHRRHALMGQADVLRKALRLDAVKVRTDYYNGANGLLRTDGDPDDFMERYPQVSTPEKVTDWYALAASVISLAMGGVAYLLRQDLSEAVCVAAVCLLAATPATIFITISRPAAILQKRLHNAGTVLCGWQAVKTLKKKSVFPVDYYDLFPAGSARLNGVKFFGSRPTDEVVAYATAVIVANGSGLAPLFTQVLDSRNGYHYSCKNLRSYDNGGIGGEVKDEPVLVGTMAFLRDMGVEIPEGMRVQQAVCVAIDGELCGLFALNYENARSAAVGLAGLCGGRKTNPVFVTDDFLLNAEFVRSRFGVNPKKLLFLTAEQRAALQQLQPDEGNSTVLLVTRDSLASFAYGISGARALHSAATVGTALHILGGVVGLTVMALLLVLGRLDLLTPANLFAYQLVWMIPGLLLSEWTRLS